MGTPKTDLSDIREGDIVLCSGTVVSVEKGNVTVRFYVDDRVRIPSSCIQSCVSQSIKVRDLVRHTQLGIDGRVLAISSLNLWVNLNDGTFQTWKQESVIRIKEST